MTDSADKIKRGPVAATAVQKDSSDLEILDAVVKSAEGASDFGWLKPGDSVFIKLAANSAKPYPGTTSREAIRAMVGLLKEKGAGRILVGDKPGVQSVHHEKNKQRGSSRKILEKNGLHKIIVESGAEPHYFDEAGHDSYFADHTESEGHWKGPLMLPGILKEVDHVVLLPRVSRHVLAGATLGLKAAVGWLRDDSRLELHRDGASFMEKTAEINDATTLREKLRLTLSVADMVQTTFGPDVGHVAKPDPGLVFASENLLAHDMIAVAWLLYCREFHTPAYRKTMFLDPYTMLPSLFNRGFVGMIWGFSNLLNSESYTAPKLINAKSDRILSRAAEMWGGWPELEFIKAGGEIPEQVLEYLKEKAD